MPFNGEVINKSVLNGARSLLGKYDVAVGNPPFVRFQFFTPEDRQGLNEIASECGLTLAGVSNLWIPVFLSALSKLAADGVFAFIVPAECFTGISASSVRRWLTRNVGSLQVDLFPPGSFPTVLQEVVVLSGRTRSKESSCATPKLQVVEHQLGSQPLRWTHEIEEDVPTWTRYLLTPNQLSALKMVTTLGEFHRFSAVARLTVSTVTGANEYFSVDDQTLAKYALKLWALPLLPRIRNASGLIFDKNDHERLGESESRRWLLNFSDTLPSPLTSASAAAYICEGEAEELHQRYKCRIRKPWYRVPVVQPSNLLLSKRSHRYPRLALNSAMAVTTDTIYQGGMTPRFAGHEKDLVAGFHNTVTLLTAEVEGRSFGGGVLELVPSEIGRLVVPLLSNGRDSLTRLDRLVRNKGADTDELVDQTDALLMNSIPGLTTDIIGTLREARASLLQRRMDRTG
jgi:adenine-specific DNA methylase